MTTVRSLDTYRGQSVHINFVHQPTIVWHTSQAIRLIAVDAILVEIGPKLIHLDVERVYSPELTPRGKTPGEALWAIHHLLQLSIPIEQIGGIALAAPEVP